MVEFLFAHFIVGMATALLGLAIPEMVLAWLGAYLLWWVISLKAMVQMRRAE